MGMRHETIHRHQQCQDQNHNDATDQLTPQVECMFFTLQRQDRSRKVKNARFEEIRTKTEWRTDLQKFTRLLTELDGHLLKQLVDLKPLRSIGFSQSGELGVFSQKHA